MLAAEWIRAQRELDGEQALAELARRFFLGHGPATIADLARWSGLTLSMARAGLAAVQDRLAVVTLDGVDHLLDPAVPDLLAQARAQARGVFLLPGFDEFVLGYADRSAVLAPAVADRVAPGGNGVFRPSVVRDGRIVGTWRRRPAGVEVEQFGEPSDQLALAVEALAAVFP